MFRLMIGFSIQETVFSESVPMKKFSPPQMKEVSFPTPHTPHPTPLLNRI
jgi:hypothetical protein